MNAQLNLVGQPAPAGSSRIKVYEGGTVWSIAGVVVAILGSLRLWALVPVALERFAFGSCRSLGKATHLTWPGVTTVAIAGLAAVVLAEYGARRQGNRWLSMIGSVLGVSCVIGGGCLIFVLLASPLPCVP